MKNRIFQALIIVATFVAAIVTIVGNTENIVLHWDFMGNATHYETKYFIILLPVISVLSFLAFLHYEKNPYKMLGKSDAIEVNDKAKLLVRCIKVVANIVLIILFYVTLCSAQFMTLHPTFIWALLIVIMCYSLFTRKKLKK